MNDTTLGIIAAAVPLIVIGFIALRRMPWIFAFFIALVAVGIGYLNTTGAVKEFGHKVRVALPAGILPEHKKAEEAAPAEGAAMKAIVPPAAPEAAPAATPPAAEPAPAPRRSDTARSTGTGSRSCEPGPGSDARAGKPITCFLSPLQRNGESFRVRGR